MKWFKHMANARDDDFMEWLEEEYGFEGVGRWWRLLEIIAAAMDKNPSDPTAKHTWAKWQILLRGKRSILLRYLSAIASRGKIELVSDDNVLEIKCTNILKLRDNHTRNLQVAEKLLPSNLALDLEKDLKKETSPLPPPVDKPPKPEAEVLKNEAGKKFDVEHHLTDAGRKTAREKAPGWDLYHLASIFNENVNSGKLDPPIHPNAAFAGWCATYTKGNPP